MIPTIVSAIGWGLGLILSFTDETRGLFISLLIGIISYFAFSRHYRGLLLLLITCCLGLGWGYLDQKEAHQASSGIFIGTIDSMPILDGDRVRFFFQSAFMEDNGRFSQEQERVWVQLHLDSKEEKERMVQLQQGDRIQIRLSLDRPANPRNPGGFDFPFYLWTEHSYFVGESEDTRNITILEKAKPIPWGGLYALRTYFEDRLSSIFSEETAGLMQGMLLGSRNQVPTELEEIYRRTGILHILAISGFHVMIVIGGLLMGLQLFRITRERALVMVMAFLPIYMALTGMSPSVLRAGLMGFIYLLALRLRQGYSAWKAISLAFMVMTLMDPRQLFQIGFQLSFGVTLGLIAFTMPVVQWLKRKIPFLPDPVVYVIAVAFVAQLAALPFLIYHFHQISLPSLIINIVVVPWYTIIVPWGYIALLMGSLWIPLGKLAAYPLDGFLQFLHWILQYLSVSPRTILSVASPSIWWMAIFLLVCILSLIPLRKYGIYRVPVILGLIGVLLLPVLSQSFQSSVSITFLDVGQGDSIIVQGPGNRAMLIDTGGSFFSESEETWRTRRNPFGVGKDIIVPALRSMGISELDWIVLTHGDGDHIGGFEEMLKEIQVHRVLVNGNPPTSELEKGLHTLLGERGISIYRAIPGPWLQPNERVAWEILAPPSGISFGNDNNSSIVLLLAAYGRYLLFTGDLEKEGEERFLATNNNLDIDLLKVAHHGSKSSSTEEFIRSLQPEVAVISVGKNNWYGHPAKEVIRRLEEHVQTILRTDHHGAITVTIYKDGTLTWKNWLN